LLISQSLVTNHRFTSVPGDVGDDGVPEVSLLAIGYRRSAIGYQF